MQSDVWRARYVSSGGRARKGREGIHHQSQRLLHDSSGREPRGGQATYRGLGSGKNAALFETYSVSQSC